MDEVTYEKCAGCRLLTMSLRGSYWVCLRDRVDNPKCAFPSIRASNANQTISSEPDAQRVQLEMFPKVKTVSAFSDADFRFQEQEEE